MMNELPLPDDVLVEILAHLSPSDIIRTRQACRRLYSASKQRALWLYIMERVHYAFPAEIDPISLGGPELEHLLVRAEVMDQVWANSCPTRCHREKYESRVPLDMPWCLGAGPCVILEQEPLKYSWYRVEQLEGPIFSYDATAKLGPQRQHLPGFRHSYVERGTDTCLIAHLLRDDSREGTQAAYHLQIIIIGFRVAGSSTTFDPVVEQVLSLDDRRLEPQRIKILNRRFVFLHYPPEYGYPHGATVLLNITTGKQTHLLPPVDHPGPTYQVGFPFRNQVDPFITPSHYIQVVNTKEISFYDLNEVSETSLIPDSSHRTLRPSHFGIITLNLLRNICIIPRSPYSFVIFGIQTLGSVLFARILTVYLGSPSSTDESSTNEVRVCVNSAVHELWGRVQNVTIPPVSPSSGTALGMIFLKDYSPATRRWEEHCLSIRVTLGCPSQEPDFLISRMNVMGGPHDGFNFHGFDPYAGRILAAYSNSEGRTRRLFALDFLPSRN